MTDSPDVRYVRSAAFVARRVADEMLLIPTNQRSDRPMTRAGDLCVLNESGEFLWRQLESPRGLEDLVQNLIFVHDLLTLDAVHLIPGDS
jgi:hypothetical protein